MRLPMLSLFLAAIAALSAKAGGRPVPPAPPTFWVTQRGDSGPGSMRAAIEAANAHPGPDHIRFAIGLAGYLPVSGTELVIRDALHIHGPGGDQVRLRGDDQNTIFRVLADAGEVTIDGLTLTNAGDSAIVNEGAALVVGGCVLRANFGTRGAAIASYGGELYVRNTLIRDNYAEARGGIDDGFGGGIYTRNTSMTIEASRLSSNTAEGIGGGLYADLPGEGALLVRGSVVDANTAWSQGGGLALHASDGPPSGILDSTISGNRSVRNAALWFDRGLVINNSTVADNYSPMMEIPGACAGLCGAGKHSELWLTSTLLAANRDVHGNGDDLGTAAGGTHVSRSLVERVADPVIDDDRGGNLLNVDPRIGPLVDNGGALPAHALTAGSPAIDAGSNPSLLQFDQRGACYARIVGAAADIGAYEYAPASVPAAYRRPPHCWIPPERR